MNPPSAAARTPETMVLTIPGSAGEVVVMGLRTSAPSILIDLNRARKTPGGGFKVPMLDGSTEIVKIKVFVPGFPTILWRDAVLFKAERAGPFIVPLALLVALSTGFAGFQLLRPQSATLLAAGVALVSVEWMKTPRPSPWLRYGPVGAAIVLFAVVGFVSKAQ